MVLTPNISCVFQSWFAIFLHIMRVPSFVKICGVITLHCWKLQTLYNAYFISDFLLLRRFVFPFWWICFQLISFHIEETIFRAGNIESLRQRRWLNTTNTSILDKWIKMVNFKLGNKIWKVNWSTWHERGTKRFLSSLTGIEPMTFRTHDALSTVLVEQWIERPPCVL